MLVLKIKYNGKGFYGYQYQPGIRTVQGVLTDAFSSCLGFPVSVTGCSRTDSGVHALGFVCAVAPVNDGDRITVPTGKFHKCAERFLPDDIAIVGEAEADSDFHPRYSVVSKTYIYKMYSSDYYDPFLAGRAWRLHKTVPQLSEKMNDLAKPLLGKHDFTSFMTAGSKITDAVREIYSISVSDEDGMTVLKVSANGFLYNMVRIIVGTLYDSALGSVKYGIPDILNSRDRRFAGRTAPPDGLYLADVYYGTSGNISAWI